MVVGSSIDGEAVVDCVESRTQQKNLSSAREAVDTRQTYRNAQTCPSSRPQCLQPPLPARGSCPDMRVCPGPGTQLGGKGELFDLVNLSEDRAEDFKVEDDGLPVACGRSAY